jgi:MerR family transcriptional regulator, redox-sensitive transcriptional activator SoxR
MTIGELAKGAGIAPSAIRFYEKAGLLKAPARVNGRRIYSEGAAHQLVLIRFAKANGFTLPEIRLLLRGFPEATPASVRWKKMARAKIAELKASITKAKAMREMLESLAAHCHCRTLEQCSKGLARHLSGGPSASKCSDNC